MQVRQPRHRLLRKPLGPLALLRMQAEMQHQRAALVLHQERIVRPHQMRQAPARLVEVGRRRLLAKIAGGGAEFLPVHAGRRQLQRRQKAVDIDDLPARHHGERAAEAPAQPLQQSLAARPQLDGIRRRSEVDESPVEIEEERMAAGIERRRCAVGQGFCAPAGILAAEFWGRNGRERPRCHGIIRRRPPAASPW
jgi:hypothetical protein